MKKKIKSDFRNNELYYSKICKLMLQNVSKYNGVVDMANLYYTLNRNIPKISNVIKKFRRTLKTPQNIFFVNKTPLSKIGMSSNLTSDEDIVLHVGNNTQDDDYVLLAALNSGIECKILSNDMYSNNLNGFENYSQLKNAFCVFLSKSRTTYHHRKIYPRQKSLKSLSVTERNIHMCVKKGLKDEAMSDEWKCIKMSG